MPTGWSDEWPEIVDSWVAIFRDITIVLLATFMLVFETVFAHEVSPYIVGAGLTLAGVPPALRADTYRRRRKADAGAPDSPTVPTEQ